MPWQRHVFDVALEVNPDTGLLVHRDVTLTVPRQSGKTTMLLVLKVHRALAWERQTISFGAQTRKDARNKWTEEHIPVLEAARRRDPGVFDFAVRLANGDEQLKWANASREILQANTESAGHGATLDLHVQDEAFSLVDSRIDQAAKPAMVTRPQPQFWRVSTAGRSPVRSPYLWGFVEAGRKAPARPGVAYFEWSAEDEWAPEDESKWPLFLPALGLTQPVDAVRSLLHSMERPEFERAVMNRWRDDADAVETVIPLASWDARVDPASRLADPVVFGFDVAPDSRSAAIVAVGRSVGGRWGDGRQVEVVDHRSGTSWLPQRLAELSVRWSPTAIVADWKGPAGAVRAEVEATVWVDPLPSMAAACEWFFAAAAGPEPTLVHVDQAALRAALVGAAKSVSGDSWVWRRRSSTDDVAPLVAATVALDAWERADVDTSYCPVF